MNKKIVLTLELSKDIKVEDIIDTVNAEVLCKFEEDLKYIVGWEWIY
jgi:hypothetical protein